MSDPTEEMVQAEIRAAVEILRSDGMHIHKTYAEFQKSLSDQAPDKPEDKTEEGKPPPVKDDKTPDPPVRKGLWWGTRQ